jgi:hypothetical protein
MVFSLLEHIDVYIQNFRLSLEVKWAAGQEAELKTLKSKDSKSNSPIYIHPIS